MQRALRRLDAGAGDAICPVSDVRIVAGVLQLRLDRAQSRLRRVTRLFQGVVREILALFEQMIADGANGLVFRGGGGHGCANGRAHDQAKRSDDQWLSLQYILEGLLGAEAIVTGLVDGSDCPTRTWPALRTLRPWDAAKPPGPILRQQR